MDNADWSLGKSWIVKTENADCSLGKGWIVKKIIVIVFQIQANKDK